MKCLFLLVALVCLLNRGTRSFVEHGVVVGGANCAASDIGFPCNLLGDCALVLRFKHALVGFLVCSLYSLFPIFVPVCECEAQTLQDPIALDVSVAIQQQAVLTCTVQYTGTVPPNITIMKVVGTLSSTT